MRVVDFRLLLFLAATLLFSGSVSRAEIQATQPDAITGQTSKQAVEARSIESYTQRIKPLFAERCYACHAAAKQEGNLRLDTAQSLRKGGDSGPAVNPADPAHGPLMARITSDNPDERMPPEGEGQPLNAAEREAVQSWIAAGAIGPSDERGESHWRDHWAFQPIQRPAVPRMPHSTTTSIQHPIDQFLAVEMERAGVHAQPPAPREILIRRLYLDLIGLPPTIAEWEHWLNDDSPDWYDQLTERLMTDPRHGERWARHWMDIWRYSDWWGLGDQLRNSQKHIWHWRDWIVESLNEDLPYDEMIRQMLAADELYPNDLKRLRATGFLARNYFLFNRNQWLDETVEHVSKGFLGLTMNCAKCHDHKYDPLSQKDYYRLRAFFEPYHVRIDAAETTTDLAKDGIPRAFDGQLETPTYLFIRGQEANPDRTEPLQPAVPEALRFDTFAIHPIALPLEAWQPERRPAFLATLRREANEACEQARRELEALTTANAASPLPSDQAARRDLLQATLDRAVAHRTSIEMRIAASEALWLRDATTTPESVAGYETLAHDAHRSQQQLAIADAQVEVARAALTKLQSKAEEQAAHDKLLAEASDRLQKAQQAINESKDSTEYQRLIAAQWTPTRFFDSTKDDTAVTFPPTSSGRRTALAAWITDRRHPLTARVAVNHLWARHLGAPLVPTLFDLGRNGTAPANQQLLDWLASELMDNGWSMKHIHRLIVTSAAYQRSSSLAGADESVALDPDNRLWWRRVPIRLEAEVVRDSILSHAGTLDETRGGPSVLPNEQAQSKRRSLYFFHSNNERNLFLTTFDEAMVKECYRRDQSIVPQQALALTNSQMVLDHLTPIAQQLSRGASDDADFVRRAFELLLAIRPSAEEITATRDALTAWQALPDTTPAAAREELIWTLINHNDYVTLR